MDWRRDRNKDISDPSLTIYDPKIQMECAVTIMNKWVPRDGGVASTIPAVALASGARSAPPIPRPAT